MKSLTMLLFIAGPSWGQVSSSEQFREYRALRQLVLATELLSRSDLSCEQHADCLAIPSGKKACGGPQRFIIASHRNYNLSEVSALAASTIEREKDYNHRYQVSSDCMVVSPPELQCLGRVCVRKVGLPN